MLSEKSVHRVAEIARKLYDHVLIDNIPNDAPYKYGVRPDGNWFMALDRMGYYELYGELLRAIFDLPKVKNVWSEDGIQEQIVKLLSDLASIKLERSVSAQSSINFGEIAQRWFEKIDVDFEVRHCYVPVIGLALSQPLVIGDVTFWPLEEKINLKDKTNDPDLFEGLHPSTDCVASCSIKAETRKTIELLSEKVESSLNILRYLSTLIWQDEPPRQIRVGQRAPMHTFALSIDSKVERLKHFPGCLTQYPLTWTLKHFRLQTSMGLVICNPC